MVPVAVGAPTAPTTLYQTQPFKPTTNPKTVTHPPNLPSISKDLKQDIVDITPVTNEMESKNTVSTAISKVIKQEIPGREHPLPVETCVSETNNKCGTEEQVHVETKVPVKNTEHVETMSPPETRHVETVEATQNDILGETESSSEDLHVNSESPLLDIKDDGMEQSDAHSNDGTMAGTDKDTLIPATETGNDNELLTGSIENPTMTEIHHDSIKQTIVLRLQPLSDIDIDIWSSKVVDYHQFKMDTTTSSPISDKNVTHEGYSLHPKPAVNSEQLTPSVRNRDVNYSSMLNSGSDTEPEPRRKKPKKY